jgi:hypothetical protein
MRAKKPKFHGILRDLKPRRNLADAGVLAAPRCSREAALLESAPFFVQTELPDPGHVDRDDGPGISAKLGSTFYGNLLEGRARGEFFPLAVTCPAVERPTKRTQSEAHRAATE